jgi:DNA-directed RNA polymerase subunit RPC12/RpoP
MTYDERMAAMLDEAWARLEEIGRLTGHVVVRCPGCSSRAMVSIVNTSGTSRWVKSGGGWPKCKQCRAAPRVEPIGDVDLVARIKPGHMATKRELNRYRKVLAAPEDR